MLHLSSTLARMHLHYSANDPVASYCFVIMHDNCYLPVDPVSVCYFFLVTSCGNQSLIHCLQNESTIPVMNSTQCCGSFVSLSAP